MHYFENKTIVVPFDFSEPKTAAIDKAIAMSDESTTIYAIHVVVPIPILISVDPGMPILPSNDENRKQIAFKNMQEVFGKGKYSRLKLECRIGDAGSEIVDFANSVESDMIIMPSHGRTGLSRILIGSVAERVLRLSSCPVLVLREPNQTE